MRKITCLIAAIACVSCTTNNELQVRVGNPNDFDRQSELVEIPLTDVEANVKLDEGESYIVRNVQGKIVPSQVTSDGKLLFQSGVKGKEVTLFYIGAGEPKEEYKTKTHGRFIQERKDDFAWENDRVAFRAYGPSLVAIDGPSNGFDAWYKRTGEMIIDKWYKDDLAQVASYHEDHGEGLDNYDVKRSLGAGAMAPYVNDTLWLNENYISWEMLDNGPLRTRFKLTYKDITADGKTFPESRTISIDAGSQLTKIVQEYGTDTPIAVASGIVKRNGNDSIITSPDKNYVIYAQPVSEVVDNVYLAMVFPQGIEKTEVNTYTIEHAISKQKQTYSHVLAVTTCQPGEPVVYYTGYGWSKFGFPTVADFQKYVADFAANLKEPLVVKY
ncbi:MAG: DUF4861 domain-containing protein [Prevotella sp.]|jgi:hypothetical protein|nr:DUF4861 domain-containing protein [Prevotella sp.]